jgi:hypothetical protein
MKAFSKVVNPGFTSDGQLFVSIKFDGQRLSITGVEGPKANGNCRGSCGQCIGALDRISRNDDWNEQMVHDLKTAWQKWHLNDMRAGCEHQRAGGWDKRPIDPTKPLDSYGCHFDGQKHSSWNMLTWVTEDEHPDGLLSKECPVCGYKYGSRWLHEDIPESVLEMLLGLPEATRHYSWV